MVKRKKVQRWIQARKGENKKSKRTQNRPLAPNIQATAWMREAVTRARQATANDLGMLGRNLGGTWWPVMPMPGPSALPARRGALGQTRARPSPSTLPKVRQKGLGVVEVCDVGRGRDSREEMTSSGLCVDGLLGEFLSTHLCWNLSALDHV